VEGGITIVVVGAAAVVVVVGGAPRCVPPVHATDASETVTRRAAALVGRTIGNLSHGLNTGREAHQRRLLGPRRRDVDLLRGVVHVHVQAQQLSGEGRVVSGPKSEAGTRTVSLLAIVIDALKQQLSEFAEPGPDGVVFTGPRRTAPPRGAL
jgi:hypothetical protein